MTLPWLVLLLSGLGCVGFGVAYAVAPGRMAAATDVALPTPSARADFVATYGGFQIGFGLFLLACAMQAPWLPVGLWGAVAALAGFAAARAAGILAARGAVRGTIWFALALEVAGASLNLWGARASG